MFVCIAAMRLTHSSLARFLHVAHDAPWCPPLVERRAPERLAIAPGSPLARLLGVDAGVVAAKEKRPSDDARALPERM